ncbi:MAG: MFS transporter [Nitrososphaeria archaeon]
MKSEQYHIIEQLKIKSSSSVPQTLAFIAEIILVLTSVYLPLYAFSIGANELMVGFIAGANSVTYIFMPFFAGRLSDKVGQNKLLLVGFGMITFSCASYYLITQPIVFIPIRAFEGLGWALIWPSLEALIGASSNRLRTFNIMWGIGATIAPFIGGIISQQFLTKDIFLITTPLALTSFLFCKFAGQQSNPKKFEDPEKGRVNHLVFYYPFLYGIATLTVTTFFPIYLYSKNISMVEVGAVLTLMNFGRLIAFFIPNGLRNRLEGNVSILALTLLIGFLPVLILLNLPIFLIYLEIFSFGSCLGIIYSIALNKIMGMAGKNRGYYAGLFESILGTGFFLGPMLGGALASFSLQYVFLMPLAFTLPFFLITGISLRNK